jgi:hypothetical protein
VVAGFQLMIGCGTTAADTEDRQESGGALSLRQVCPGVHAAYDRLVASDPASARVFEQIVGRLRAASERRTRDEVVPVVDAAHALAGVDRAGFPVARDRLYAAVSRFSSSCATVGSPILHDGH